jgi:cytochrome c
MMARMKINRVLAVGLGFVFSGAGFAMAAAPGDAAKGAALFGTNCAACHSADKGGGDLQGPNLYSVYGRKAGSEPGFAYSAGFKQANFSWDAAHLDKWLTQPTAVISTTYMMYAQPDAQVRADIIAYLKSLGGK